LSVWLTELLELLVVELVLLEAETDAVSSAAAVVNLV